MKAIAEKSRGGGVRGVERRVERIFWMVVEKKNVVFPVGWYRYIPAWWATSMLAETVQRLV